MTSLKPTDSSTGPMPNKQPAKPRKMNRWIKRGLFTFAALYLLLCTHLWIILYDIFLIVVTNNAPMYQVTASPWCRPGDWVLDTFQPMVSDQRMIDHLNNNREAMTRVAEMAGRGQVEYPNGRNVAEFKAMVKAAGMGSVGRNAGNWAEQPYSLDGLEDRRQCYIKATTQTDRDACRSIVTQGGELWVVDLTPGFGKNWAKYFCTAHRNSFKSYRYYPGPVPRIEDGYITEPLTYSDIAQDFVSARSYRLVGSLDLNSDAKDWPVYRQIDDRWFIVRN